LDDLDGFTAAKGKKKLSKVGGCAAALVLVLCVDELFLRVFARLWRRCVLAWSLYMGRCCA
jgi:hypothetical protein